MRLSLKYNGLAWYVEHDSSYTTNELYVYSTDGSLSHVVSESYLVDYDGDGTEVFEETTSGCTFYKYTGAIDEHMCAMPIEDSVFKLVERNEFNEPFLLNSDKSRLDLDVALKKSEVIAGLTEVTWTEEMYVYAGSGLTSGYGITQAIANIDTTNIVSIKPISISSNCTLNAYTKDSNNATVNTYTSITTDTIITFNSSEKTIQFETGGTNRRISVNFTLEITRQLKKLR